jgi:pantetheine-phosphate adenylyltransferase
VIHFEGLLVDTARQQQAKMIVRGLRQSQDFNYELPMVLMNRALAPDIETLFLTTDQEFMHISSSLVREILAVGGEIYDFVPEEIAEPYQQR